MKSTERLCRRLKMKNDGCRVRRSAIACGEFEIGGASARNTGEAQRSQRKRAKLRLAR